MLDDGRRGPCLGGTGLVADDLYLLAHHDVTGRPLLQPRPLRIALARLPSTTASGGYIFALGREGVLPAAFGRTGTGSIPRPRWPRA